MLTADVFIFTDIDECLQMPEICELGSCTNIGGGGFYTCTCPPGTISTGTNTDNSLRCIGKLVASFDIYYSSFFSQDFDECSVEPDVCGSLGTCTNNDGGSFYECDCQDGAETSGTGNTLTCVGRSTNHAHILLSFDISITLCFSQRF